MPIQNMADILDALDRNPEWRAELRQRILSDEFLTLPAAVRSLAAAQERTELRVVELAAAQHRTELRVEELVAAQQRTEQRVEELAAAQQRTELRVEELAAAQQRTEQRVEELVAAIRQTNERVDTLVESIDRLTETVERHEQRLAAYYGDILEGRYLRHAPAFFGGLIRKPKVVSIVDLEDELLEKLTLDELKEIYQIDLVVAGRPRRSSSVNPVYLMIEVSGRVNQHDLDRALRRASLMKKAGNLAVAVVAGENTDAGVPDNVIESGAVLFLNGAVVNPEKPFVDLNLD